MELIVIIGYVVALVLLALAIGFSPLLYGTTVRLSADHRGKLAGRWLIAGVVVGIVSMFLLGNAIGLLLEYARLTIAQIEAAYRMVVGLVGGGLVVYAFVGIKLRRKVRPVESRSGKTLLMQGLLLFVVGLVRTATSISGLSAVMLISAAIATRSLAWPVTVFVLMPVVCFVAVLPFLLLLRGGRWYEFLHKRSARVTTTARRRVEEYYVVIRPIVLQLGLWMLAYAGRGIVW
ncbi:MAG: hypothetical protein WBP12_02460 [Candidatus Saccharimonas sp.]